ncbi:MAG: NADH-quinone oxidoreductase subunit J [Streptosporangiales bacterium]|nr:NADH-quinone oxidoreductase subunit J [Streptosporangiales bacterium]
MGMILVRRAVHSALMLAVVMLSLAVMYAMQEAPFLAFVQVIVYTGAVLMLFLFVLMLVGVQSSDSLVETIRGQRFFAFVGFAAFLVLLLLGVGNAGLTDVAMHSVNGGAAVPTIEFVTQAAGGNMGALAYLIFRKYVFAFEVTSALLITAALGAMVLAHRERTTKKATQKEMSRERIAGPHPTPLPGPGTYARHNAVDMPALLPDGTPSELSVNPVIARRQDMAGHRTEVPREDLEEVSEIVEEGSYEEGGSGAPERAIEAGATRKAEER